VPVVIRESQKEFEEIVKDYASDGGRESDD
jgi:hypothetical protein